MKSIDRDLKHLAFTLVTLWPWTKRPGVARRLVKHACAQILGGAQ